jgi:YbbR domain-containing protein
MTQAMRNGNGRLPWLQGLIAVVRGTVTSLYEHWLLALVSLVAAFAIWFVIQDVENPRVEAQFPAEGEPSTIEVEAVNADRLIPNQTFVVEQLTVQGREDDLEGLTADDFEATIDVKDIPANSATSVPVKVNSTRDGVKVLSVVPATVIVTLEPVQEREMTVTLNPSGQLATGFKVDDTKIEPVTVTLSGLRERIDNVVSVDLDVPLGNLREGSNLVDGELKARSNTGVVNVNISPARGKVTYTVSQEFVQRSLPVAANVNGQVAAGYRLGNIVFEPPVISVSGRANDMANLTEIRTEPIQLGNAKSEIRLIANISNVGAQANLSLERQQVAVRIEVKPLECTGGAANTPCGAMTLQVGPTLDDLPLGLAIVTNPVRAFVVVSGPLPVLETLAANSGQITARVSLAGGAVGPGAFPVTVNIPANLASQGVKADPVPPISLTLGTP